MSIFVVVLCGIFGCLKVKKMLVLNTILSQGFVSHQERLLQEDWMLNVLDQHENGFSKSFMK